MRRQVLFHRLFTKFFFRTLYNLHLFLHSSVHRLFSRDLDFFPKTFAWTRAICFCSPGSFSDLRACFINIQRINCYRCSKLMHLYLNVSKSVNFFRLTREFRRTALPSKKLYLFELFTDIPLARKNSRCSCFLPLAETGKLLRAGTEA